MYDQVLSAGTCWASSARSLQLVSDNKTEPVKTMPGELELLWLSGALWGCFLAGRATAGWVDEESWCHPVRASSRPVVSPLPNKMGVELSDLRHLWSFAVHIIRWSGNSCFGHSLENLQYYKCILSTFVG